MTKEDISEWHSERAPLLVRLACWLWSCETSTFPLSPRLLSTYVPILKKNDKSSSVIKSMTKMGGTASGVTRNFPRKTVATHWGRHWFPDEIYIKYLLNVRMNVILHANTDIRQWFLLIKCNSCLLDMYLFKQKNSRNFINELINRFLKPFVM